MLLKIGTSSQQCDVLEDNAFRFDDNYSNEELILFILRQEGLSMKTVDSLKFGLKSHRDQISFSYVHCNFISTHAKLLEPSDEEIIRHLRQL